MDSPWVSSPENSPTCDQERELFRASATLTWMIQRSITTDCLILDNKIAKALSSLSSFVRHVREARSDADAVSRELHSLQTVLALLREDVALFPPELAAYTPIMIERCSYVVDKLENALAVSQNADLSKQEKREQWLGIGKRETEGFRTTLEAHRATLGLALDLVGATTMPDLTSNSEDENKTSRQRQQVSSEVMTDISRILIEMDQLRTRLPVEFDKTPRFCLHDYMGYMKLFAERIIRCQETEHELDLQTQEWEQDVGQLGAPSGEKHMFGGYMSNAPDSAIDVDSEPFNSPSVGRVHSSPSVGRVHSIIEEEDVPVDNVMDIPSRAPTPPPRDAKRLEVARPRMAPPIEDTVDFLAIPYGFVTEVTSNGHKFAPSIASSRRKGFGRFFHAFKSSVPESRPSTQSTSSSTSVAVDAGSINPVDAGPINPVAHASRPERASRSSHRLSMSINKKLPWNAEPLQEVDGPELRAVFGVTLQRSMQVAKGSSKTHHSGNGGSSRRDFPLCIQKCCFFLKNEGVLSPGLFAEPGDIFRISKLKEIFSKGPKYGEDINWAGYTAYDAADLIMLYLSQLPRPLIPESLAKRWISLSRQATLSGSHATRLDQCMDFWEEALSGLRGPSRSVFKLLLNLWADVAAGEEENDMTAERLAGVVLKPLTHISSTKYRTDYMLSLAFLIRRRIEYNELLTDNQSAMKRISRAAW